MLQRRVQAEPLADHARLLWWMSGRRPFQMFPDFTDDPAGSWSHPRHLVTKIEITRTGGTNIRHVITHRNGPARDIDHGFDTPRGNVPERPLGERKNGLNLDRLRSHRCLANAQKRMVHVRADLRYALFRAANAQTPELKTRDVGTARVRLFQAGAVLKVRHRRIWLHVASHWPGRHLLTHASPAVAQETQTLVPRWRTTHLLVPDESPDPRDRHKIHFAPLPLQ